LQLLLLKFETVWLLIKLSSTCAHHNQLRKNNTHSLTPPKPKKKKTNQQKNPQAQKLLFTPSPSKSPSFQTSVKGPVSHQELSCEKEASSHPSTPTLTPPLLLFLSSRARKWVLLGNLLFFFLSLPLVPLRTLLNFPMKRSNIQNREQEKKRKRKNLSAILLTATANLQLTGNSPPTITPQGKGIRVEGGGTATKTREKKELKTKGAGAQAPTGAAAAAAGRGGGGGRGAGTAAVWSEVLRNLELHSQICSATELLLQPTHQTKSLLTSNNPKQQPYWVGSKFGQHW
jgi:hypothetical protein